MESELSDLLYLDSSAMLCAVRDGLAARFPDANIEDASDAVHEYRLSVNLAPGTPVDDYWKWLYEKDVLQNSFSMQVKVKTKPNEAVKILEAVGYNF